MTILKDVSSSINGVAELQKFSNLRISKDKVYYTQSVGRYIESSVTLPVQPVNVPEGRKLTIIQDNLTVNFRYPMSLRKKFSKSDFVLVLDYEDFIKSPTSKVRPKIAVAPEGIFKLEMVPAIVECIEI